MYYIELNCDVIHFDGDDRNLAYASGMFQAELQEIEKVWFNSITVKDENDNVIFSGDENNIPHEKAERVGNCYADGSCKYIGMKRYGATFYYTVEEDEFSEDSMCIMEGQMETPAGIEDYTELYFGFDVEEYRDYDEYGDYIVEMYEKVGDEWVYRTEEVEEDGRWEKWCDAIGGEDYEEE